MDRGPKTLNWREGEPVPPGYHLGERPRAQLAMVGASILGGAYLPMATFSIIDIVVTSMDGGRRVSAGDPGAAAVFCIPVAGPFIAMGTTRPSGTYAALLATNGVLQTGGLAMLVTGLVAREKVLIRNDVGKGFVMPMPMTFGANSAGVGLVGSF